MTDTLSFKKLTLQNWLEQEKALKHLVILNGETGEERSITSADWFKSFSEPELPLGVPLKVRELFEVARGCMIYGFYFYPLYAHGMEQLFHVMDAATYYRCKELGDEKAEKRRFERKISYLVQAGEISPEDEPRWHYARKLRNSSAHRVTTMLIPPTKALGILRLVCDDITKLFASDALK